MLGGRMYNSQIWILQKRKSLTHLRVSAVFPLINDERLQVLMGRCHNHSYTPDITESIHTGA